MFIFESLVPEQLPTIIVSLHVCIIIVVYAGMIFIYHLLTLFVITVVVILALVIV